MISNEIALTHFPEALVLQCLQSRWSDVHIETVTIIAARASATCRLNLTGPGVPGSVIVKYVLPDTNDTTHRQFFEELVIYRLLSGNQSGDRLTPVMYAYDKCGILVLEDVAITDQTRPFSELVYHIVNAVTLLHHTGRNLQELHSALLNEYVVNVQDDFRWSSARTKKNRQRITADSIRNEVINVLHWPDTNTLNAELLAIETSVNTPGVFLTLLHDDLIGQRQMLDTGDRFLMIDFEQAKYGHALMELCPPIIGKIEWSYTAKTWLWACPGFKLELADTYRATMKERYGWEVDDTTWYNALGATLAYAAFVIVGELIAKNLKPIVGSPRSITNSVFFLLGHLLRALQVYPELCRFCEQFNQVDSFAAMDLRKVNPSEINRF